jgi:hypothetical protein
VGVAIREREKLQKKIENLDRGVSGRAAIVHGLLWGAGIGAVSAIGEPLLVSCVWGMAVITEVGYVVINRADRRMAEQKLYQWPKVTRGDIDEGVIGFFDETGVIH